jgi:carbonic anhydrase
VSQKLVIIVAVQSALVVGIGGVALGRSMTGPAAHGKAKAKRHHPAPEAEPAPAEHEPHAAKKPAHPAESSEPAHAADGQHTAEPAGDKAVPALTAASPKDDHGRPDAAAQPVPLRAVAPRPRDPLEAFAWLDEGNSRWAQGHLKSRDLVAQREASAGQVEPWAMVVTCSDGRAAPEAVFDTGPGAISSVRWPSLKPVLVLSNTIDAMVRRHAPKVVVILGHEGCEDLTAPAAATVTALSVKVLASKDVRARIQANALLVLRASYDLKTGRVRWLDSEESEGPAQARASSH